MTGVWIRAALLASAFSIPAYAENLASAGPGAPGPEWGLEGTARLTAEGIALTAESYETGGLRLLDPIPLDRLTVRLELLIDEGAACGADGFALVLTGDPFVPVNGRSGLGFAGISGRAIAVEFDLWGNPGADPGLPGPAGAHVGLAATSTGFLPGPVVAHVWAPLTLGAGRWRIEVTRVSDHVIVRGGRDGEALAIWLDSTADLPSLYEGYVMVTAATGSLSGAQTLARVDIERPAAVPPRINGMWEQDDTVRIAWDELTPITAVEVFRDGLRIGEVAGGTRIFAEPIPAPGDHLYELRGRAETGEVAPTQVLFVAGPQALLFDPLGLAGIEKTGAAAIARALRQDGIIVTVARDLVGLDLGRFSSIWWANGSFPRQHIPLPEEEALLAAYLDGATRDGPRALYAEGGDLFSFLPRHALAGRDGVAGIDDGDGDPIADLRSAAEGLLDAVYEGPAYEIDRITPAPEECEPCEATVLFTDRNDAGVVIGVVDEENGRRMIFSSVEMRGFGSDSARGDVLRFYRGFLGIPGGLPRLIRGDFVGDGVLDIGDCIATLNHLFADGQGSTCPDASDTNDNGAIEIGDPIYLLNALFAGAVLPPPGLACGPDLTADDLGDCVHLYCR